MRAQAVALLLMALPAIARAEAVRLAFDVTETTITLPDMKARPDAKGAKRTTTREAWVVTIGKDAVMVAKPSETVRWDFARRRILQLNHDAKTWTESSLYTVIAFRTREMENRIGMQAGFEAAGMEPVYDRVELESLFGIAAPGPAGSRPPGPALSATPTGARGWQFTDRRGQEVAAFTPSTTAVPAACRDGYRRFLTYACQLHPSVRTRLAGEPVAGSLWFVTKDTVRIEEVGMTLTGAGPAEEPVLGAPVGYAATPGKAGGRRLLEVVNAAGTAVMPPAAERRARVLAFVKEASGAGRYLDAFLGIMEYKIETGQDLPDEIKAVLDGARPDPRMHTLAGAISPQTQEAADAGAKAIAGIERKGLRKGHMLDIYRGNDLATAGDFAGGEESMLAALGKNPLLVGAFGDLGRMFFTDYRMAEAWACWDAARRLAPGHPFLAQIGEMEADLLASYPDYF